MGWTDDGSDKTGNKVDQWFFCRNGTHETPIRFGETIALGYGKSPSFLCDKKRTVGINLKWSKEPVFEWKILGGKIGDVVHTQEWIAIYNVNIQECLIYFNRPLGGDIGWPSSQSWEDIVKDVASEITQAAWKEAQQAAVTALLG